MRPRSASRLGWLSGICAALALIALGVPDRVLTHIAYAAQRGRLQASSEELARLEDVSRAFRLVAQVARPGVVQIRVEGSDVDREELERAQQEYNETARRIQELERRMQDDGRDAVDTDELFELIRTLRELEAKRDNLLERLQSAAGSGIIWDERGHILTNNHVVEGRSVIRVTLDDGREGDATLVGADAKTDLAVIRADLGEVHPLPFGDSDKMEVGDWVIAVGAPFGLTHTVTHGIISAKGRTNINAPGRQILYQDFLQTDASINPGNSGGPLLNLRAEVVGVNTAIATHGDTGNAGVAFTIPSNMAARIARQLIESGSVARGWLGVQLAELDARDIDLFRLGKRGGVMVDVVYEGGAAHNAGMACEDVILKVNGVPVDAIDPLRAVIADAAPGERVRIDFSRDGAEHSIELPLDRQPDDVNAWVRAADAVRSRTAPPLPLELRTLRTAEAEQLAELWEYPDLRGVLVLATGSSGGRLEIARSEVLVGVDGRPIRSVADLQSAIAGAGVGKSLALDVVSPDGRKRTVEFRP